MDRIMGVYEDTVREMRPERDHVRVNGSPRPSLAAEERRGASAPGGLRLQDAGTSPALLMNSSRCGVRWTRHTTGARNCGTGTGHPSIPSGLRHRLAPGRLRRWPWRDLTPAMCGLRCRRTRGKTWGRRGTGLRRA